MFKKVAKQIEMQPEGRFAIILFFLAFALRAAYAIFHYYTQPLPATNLYYELAQEVIEQGKVFYDTSRPYYEFPGPFIIWVNALTMLVFGKNYLGLYLVTALVSGLITLYTYKTARLIVNKSAAVIIGLWSAFYFFYFYFTPSPGKDTWMAFFMIFLVHELIVLFINRDFKWWRYLLFIFMFTCSFHLDERFFIFSPFLFFFILYYENKGFTKFQWRKSVVLASFTMLLMVPWTIRNYHKHGKVVILSTRTEKFTDPIFGYESRGHMLDKYNDVFGFYYLKENQIDSVAAGLKTHTDMGYKIPPTMVEAIRKGNRPRLLTGIRAAGIRLLAMFEPFQIKGRFEKNGYYYYKKSLRNNLATFLFYGVLFFFSIPGFYYLHKINRKVFYLMFAIIIIYALIHAITIPYTNWRYRLPLDAFFIIVGWVGAIELFNKVFKKNYKGQSQISPKMAYFRTLFFLFFPLVFFACSSDLPTVLVIGDSISLGYTPYLKEELKGNAVVKHIGENARSSTYGCENIGRWIKNDSIDIILFNWGLWDLVYRLPAEGNFGEKSKNRGIQQTDSVTYSNNLEKIIASLRSNNAELYFVTTTYIPNSEPGMFTEDAEKYNSIAKRVMNENGIEIIDIYDISKDLHSKYGKGDNNIHYTKKGYKELGIYISRILKNKI